ncbi:MAG: hypothetical protein QNJ72_42650 [Pleurocapsa sp. MO_226.B13]|nr:hypothetical protein [Pleurocapsa sp. MO_226.B13]
MKLTRRVVLTGFMAIIFARLFPEKSVRGQETDSVDIQWRVPREQVKTVKEELNFDGEITGDESTIEDSKGLPLIYIFAGVVAVSQLARTLLEVYRDVRYGGLVVHSKNGEVLIDNDPRFSSGTMIIIQGEEVKVFQDKNQPQPTEVINALKPLMKK